MVIDIASSFNQNLPVLDLELYPPMCVHLVRWIMYNFLGMNSLRDEVGGHNFQELSKMLYYLNNRWKIIDDLKIYLIAPNFGPLFSYIGPIPT